MKTFTVKLEKDCSEFRQVFDPQEEGEYYIKLVLLMTSRNVDVMQFIPALSFTKVLGLGGGYLGLWLGLSLVRIINRSFFFVSSRRSDHSRFVQ